MGQSPNVPRFRTNPIELAIFSIVTVIFVNSLYNLLYDHGTFNPTVLQPMAANPISEGRIPAGFVQTFQNMGIDCESQTTLPTSALRLRLTGPLCGIETGPNGNPALTKSVVVNKTTHYAATVFADSGVGKFSTDYIPLKAGPNLIHLEFSYANGQGISRDITVQKN